MDTIQLMEAAAKLEKAKAWKELRVFAQDWAEQQPNNQFAWQALGIAARHLGDTAQAVAAYKKGLEKVPRERIELFGKPLTAGPILYGLAHTYAEAGETDLAKQTFMQAAKADPDTVGIWNDLGVLCIQSKDAKGAFEALSMAVSLDGRNINSLRNLGLLYAMCRMAHGVEFIRGKLLDLDPRAAADFMERVKLVEQES